MATSLSARPFEARPGPRTSDNPSTFGARPIVDRPPVPVRFPLRPRPDWFDEAACRGVGPDPFFARTGQPLTGRAYCEDCRVAVQCATLGTGEDHGLWGGLSVNQRLAIRPRRRRASHTASQQ